MKTRNIPLFDLTLSKQTVKQVTDTLESGWLSTGPRAAEFEEKLADLLGVRYVAAVNSATTGLMLSLQTLGITSGREVITTPLTFVATVEAILQCGATPVFADIDPDTFTIDPDEIERKISDRTAAIMPVDIAGYPCDYDRLKPLAGDRRIPLIADASHALGALHRRQSIARKTDAAIYSFHSTKNLTCGEGGLVASKFKPFIERVRLLSRHGMSMTAYQRRQKKSWLYDVTQLGLKGNMSDVLASIGLGQLREFERNQKRRERVAQRYSTNLKDFSEFFEIPKPVRRVQHAWHLYIIRLHLSRLDIDRDQFIAEMADAGIECGVHYQPIFSLSLYNELGLNPQHYPNAEYCGRRVISLPMFPGLKMRDVDYICRCIADIVDRHKR